MGPALIREDDPAGQLVLEMATLALVLTQVAEDRRVLGDHRSRLHHGQFHRTPPYPGHGMQAGPKVAWGCRYGKSQQPSKVLTLPATPEHYKHHRFPGEIISHGVWFYYRFCLSYRDVEELLFARGVIVAYEAIRKWYRKFGQQYANQLRRQRSRPGDKWDLDEVFLTPVD